MKEFLGETLLPTPAQTPYEGFDASAWALAFISSNGQTDGSHHKAWVLDQVARVLHGTPVLLRIARWSDGSREYRFETGEPSPAYLRWVQLMLEPDPITGEPTYDYDEGTPP